MPNIEEFLAPISPDEPAGEDVRYDVVYDEIKDARDFDPPELQATWQEGDPPFKAADHKKARKLAEEVLKKRSKHLQVAAWLAEAWTHLEGLEGFVAGVDLQRRLLEDFWDSVHPAVEDGDLDYRAAPLEWADANLGRGLALTPLTPAGYCEAQFQESRNVPSEAAAADDSDKAKQREAAVAEGRLTPEEWDADVARADRPFLEALRADLTGAGRAVDALREVSLRQFGEDGPGFKDLRESVTRLERVMGPLFKSVLGAAAPATGTPPEGGAGAGESGGGGSGASGTGGVPLEPTSRDDAGTRIAAAARFLRASDPLDPAPYLMVRGLRWGELRRRPGEVDPRLLAAPPTAVRTRLKGLLLDGEWARLLDAAEDVMATAYGRGWLDLQRYVFTALDGMGSEYGPVEASLRSALRGLLIDVPELPDLTLMDDTPTANRETRTWLAEEGLSGPLTESERARLDSDTAAAAPVGRDVSERARERVRAGQPQKAIELLMRAADEAGSVRGRTLRRAEAAGIMVDHGLVQVALPILRDIKDRIEQHRLEEWEDSETVAVPMALLYRALERTGGDAGEREELYLRVCKLDPMQAILFTASDEPSGSSDAGAAHAASAGDDDSPEE